MRWLDAITDIMDMNLGKLKKMVRDKEIWHAVVHGQLNNHNNIYIYDKTPQNLHIRSHHPLSFIS